MTNTVKKIMHNGDEYIVRDGDVIGPASSTDGNIATYDGATGKLIKDSGIPVTDLNTKTFSLSSISDLTTAQEIYERVRDGSYTGKGAIVELGGYQYYLSYPSGSEVIFTLARSSASGNSYSSFEISKLIFYIDLITDTVDSISTNLGTDAAIGRYLETDVNYSTPYTPQYNGSPSTKQYTDEHGPNIPVYYYSGGFNSDITFNIIEAGEYRLYIRAYHGTTVDKTLTLTVDGVTAGTLTSNLIEHLSTSINFTASAGSTVVLSVSSTTNFQVQEVYVEKINIQSGYLTATVN